MTILVAHDFQDGTLGNFVNPYASVGGLITVKPDPTLRGEGRVADIHFENFPDSGNFDSNIAIAPAPAFNPGKKLGEELWCGWKFYLDTDGLLPAIRKLCYWGWSNDSWGFQRAFNFVIALVNSVAPPIPAGSQLQWLVNAHLVAADGTLVSSFGPEVPQAGPGTWYGPANVTTKAWHKLKVYQKLNSSFTAQDGILRIWFDDVLLFECVDMHWTDPSWPDDPATYQWVDYRIGEQLNGSAKLVEERYLDNPIFATTEAEVDAYLGSGGSGGVTPPTQVLTTLQVRPSSASIGVGGAQSLTVTALDQFGVSMDVPALTLHTSNVGVADLTDSPLQAVGIGLGTCELWVTAGSVESNHVSTSVVNLAPVLTSLVLGPDAVSGIVAVPSFVNVGAFDQNGAPMNLPPLVNQASNGAVALINGPPQGNSLEIECLQAGIAHVWVTAGELASNKVTVLVSDPRGGKGHHGHK